MADTTRIRLAAAQIAVPEDPRDSAALRRSGQDIRRLMHQARQLGARIVHFPEGATCSPPIDIAVSKARPWRRKARAGAYDTHQVHDERSDDRQNF